MHDFLVPLIQQLVNGFSTGSIYVLIALGITVVFGLTGIVNFAVGEFMAVSALIVVSVVSDSNSFVVAAIFAVALMGVLGVGVEPVLFRWTLKNPINGFIVSLGLILVLQSLEVRWWGTEYRSIPQPVPNTFAIFGVRLAAQNLIVLAVASAAMVTLVYWLYRTKQGRALRAASEDREVAELMGIDTRRLTTLVFSIGLAFAGLAGALIASLNVVYPYMSGPYLLKGFAIAIIGGLGNVFGTFAAGFIVAIVESLSFQYLPIQWTDGYVFAVMIVILLIRPNGLFGAREVRRA
jgi:branched-chain amino acid transport system permease protein